MKKNEETKRLVWKLQGIPQAEDINRMVELRIITPEEARQIIFRPEIDYTISSTGSYKVKV